MINTTVIDRIKDGMHEAGRLYGYVDNIYGNPEYVDAQVKRGLENNLFPFPVYYAIKQAPLRFQVLRVFLKKDLTEGTFSGYLSSVADPDNWRNKRHADAMAEIMQDF